MKHSNLGVLLTCIDLEENKHFPIYHRLYLKLRTVILSGQLEADTRLPSTRILARDLSLSRTPVKAAYERLRDEGYIKMATGSGTTVSKVLGDRSAQKNRDSPDQTQCGMLISKRGEQSAKSIGYSVSDKSQLFTPHLPAFDEFPLKTWSRLVARQWRQPDNGILGYSPLGGLDVLRKTLTTHLKTFRGLQCDHHQVVITTGVQSAFFILARLLAQEGEGIYVEDPGDIGARSAFRAAGLSIYPVPVDNNGFCPPAQETNRLARLAHITPSRQWPLGMTMHLERRLQILEWAHTSNTWIIEDDYDSELMYSGPSVQALQGIDHTGSVIYVGGFSKILFPALRIGYAVLPHHLVDPFMRNVEATTRGPSVVSQAALAQFIQDGHFTSHIRHIRRVYARRQKALIETIGEEIGDLLRLETRDGGAHVIGWLSDGIDPEVVRQRAKERNITVVPLSRYSILPPQKHGIVLGFGYSSSENIKSAARQLALAIQDA